MNIDRKLATAVLVAEAASAVHGQVDSHWQHLIENFSRICDEGTRTHIAFLGTAILAKATNIEVDVWCVKARSSEPGAYSARGLGHGVLVTNAPALGINLGVTGREPLNNQPYFQIDRVTRNITVHGNARIALDSLCDILEELSKVTSVAQARVALRAFIFVRRQWNPSYGSLTEVAAGLSVDQLIAIIREFVAEDSEGGKRAQAVVAGLMDLYVGAGRVITSRINDPDRNLPGDVGVKSASAEMLWEKTIEVRDKLVKEPDLYHYAQKAMEHQVGEAALIAVNSEQPVLTEATVREWARERGVSLTLFRGWDVFIRQVLFWSEPSSAVAIRTLATLIFSRLKELEVSEAGVETWLQRIKSK